MKNIKTSGLTITSYGAAQDIGKSSFLITDNNQGRKILLDCGIQIYSRRSAKKSDGPNQILESAEELDAVILSHAHLDHSGYIPALYQHGFEGKVYTTRPTVDIIQLLWADHLKIEGSYHYDEYSLIKAIENLKGFNYRTKIKIADGIYTEFYDAGHILGSAQINLDFDGMMIWYTGDINDQPTPFHDGFDIPDEEIDILLTETTNVDRPVPKREKVLKDLLDTTFTTYKRGGKMLIPSFALGRSQEIQFYLMDHLGDFLSSYPLIVDGLILKMNEIYAKYFDTNWVSEKAITAVYDRGFSDLPFDHTHLQVVSRETISGNLEKHRKKLMESKKRKIILSTSGMVEGGPMHSYLKWQKSPNDTLALVGYQAEDTIGRDIKNGIRKFDLTSPWGEDFSFNIQSAIENFGFSGHASRKGIVDLIEKTNPARIFTLHGTNKAQKKFKMEIEKKNGLTIEQMTLFDPVQLA